MISAQYVDGLELRIRELEGELAALKAGQGEPAATANVGNGTFYVTAKPEQLSKLGFNLDEIQEISLYTQAPTIPEGYRLVPKYPTRSMVDAGYAASLCDADLDLGYSAMVAAAPQPGE